MSDPVAASYNRDPQREWTRLERTPYNALEFDVTWQTIQDFLPPGIHLLDAGGGPGRYALALCRAGWRVTLFDLSSGLLEVARTNFAAEPAAVQDRLQAISQGDLRDLAQFSDGVFEGVVCLGGPLSHIPEPAERLAAVREMARVVRPGGMLILSGVGFLAVQRWMLNNQSRELVEEGFEEFLRSGNIQGATGSPWHFFRAAGLRALAEEAGLETIAMRGCQGISSSLVEATNFLAGEQPDLWEAWHRLVLRTAGDPTLVDVSEHILWVGQKP